MNRARSFGTSPTPGAADTRQPGPTHAIIERTVSGQRVTQCPPAGQSEAPAAAHPAHVGGTSSEGFEARIRVIRSTSESKSGEVMGGELLVLFDAFRSVSSASIIATRRRCRSTLQSVDRKTSTIWSARSSAR